MPQTSSTQHAEPWWKSRGAAAGVFIAIVLAGTIVYCGPTWPYAMIRLLTDGAMLTLWLAGALGFGGLVLSLIFPSPSSSPLPPGEGKGEGELQSALPSPIALTPALSRPERGKSGGTDSRLFNITTALALGFGVLGFATLGLGLLGWLNRMTAFALLAVGWGCGALALWKLGVQSHRNVVKAALRRPAGWGWLWLLAAPSAAVALSAAFAPAGVLWKDISGVGGAAGHWQSEPHGYDVVEYHLQVPREWYEAGRVVPLRHNVFSYFPFNVEMHYLLAMHLTGGPWAGMYLAQLIHLAFMTAAVGATCAIAGRWTPCPGGHIAGVAMAVVPWTALLAPIAYNEAGVLLWSFLALGWTLDAAFAREEGGPRGDRLRHWIIAGVLTGLACGAKLTAVPMTLLPLAAVGVFGVMLSPRRALADDRFRLILGALLLPVVGLLVFMPWLMRTRAWSGNPFFPEGTALFGQGSFNEVQVERWRRAHAAPAEQRSAVARVVAFGRETIADPRFGYALTPLALAGFWFQRKRPWALAMASLLALMALFWIGFTHLQSRFFVPAVPIAAVLASGLAPTRRGAVAAALLLAFMSLGVDAVQLHARLYDAYYRRVGTARLVDGLVVEKLEDWLTPVALQEVPPEEIVGLVGDARVFWNQRPMRLIRYRTVFDVASDDESSDLVAAWLADDAKGVKWFLVDPEELNRFAKTYWRTPRLHGEAGGRGGAYIINR